MLEEAVGTLAIAGTESCVSLEHRRNMDYDEMKKYLQLLRGCDPPTEISWANLDWKDFAVITKGKSRLLQAADCLCGALSDALEWSPLGFVEPRYALSLADRFYRRDRNLFSYGLKFLHANRQTLDSLREEYRWLKNMGKPQDEDTTIHRLLTFSDTLCPLLINGSITEQMVIKALIVNYVHE
jgi:hypothetical protein